jgi:hypothetical protein
LVYRPVLPVCQTGFVGLANRVGYGFLNPAPYKNRLRVTAEEEAEEIQQADEGGDPQSCPWAVRHHQRTTSYRMLGMGGKKE